MDTKQLEGLWATRPIRPSAGRTVGGVCAGVGSRYQIDPTLIKVAFVVATLFGGSGILLYIAAWIAFPGEGRLASERSPAPQPGRRQESTADSIRNWDAGGPRAWYNNPALIAVIVLVILALSSIGPNQTWSSGGLLGTALMAVGWWLLYLRTPQPPAGTSVDTYISASAPEPTGQFQRWTPRDMTRGHIPGTPVPHGTIPAEQQPATPVPPAWDPLGTARFAWDLPEPSGPEPKDAEHTKSSPLTLIVVGLAVLTAAGGIAAAQAGADWFTPGRIAAASLAVVGLGLFAGSMRRRPPGRHSNGLATIAAVLGATVIVLTGLGHAGDEHGWDGIPGGGVGERTWKPMTENDIRSEYSVTVGSAQLDLRDLELSGDRSVEVRNGIGEVKIMVPPEMNVRSSCSTTLGSYECPDGLSVGDDPEAPILSIDAHAGIGEVKVLQ